MYRDLANHRKLIQVMQEYKELQKAILNRTLSPNRNRNQNQNLEIQNHPLLDQEEELLKNKYLHRNNLPNIIKKSWQILRIKLYRSKAQ